MADDGVKIKVGALVLVSLALLVGFVALLGTFSLGDRVPMVVELGDSGGLLSGAPVRIAGVRAGRVEAVEFLVDSEEARTNAAGLPVHVRLQISIDADKFAAVRNDSEFFVTSQGVLGEKYLEIRPGSAKAEPLAADTAVRGQDPARIDLIFARAESILSQIEAALSGGGELGVGDLVASVTKLSSRANAYLDKHQDRLDAVTEDLVATGADLRAITGSLRVAVGSGDELAKSFRDLSTVVAVFARESGPLSRVARDALGNLEKAAAEVSGLIEAVQTPMEPLLEELPQLLATVRGMMADVQGLIARIKDGQGVVGQVLVDDEIYADLKEMLRDLKRNPWKLLWRE